MIIRKAVLLLFGLIFSVTAFATVPITLMNTKNGNTSVPIDVISRIVVNNILSRNDSHLAQVKVQIIYNDNQTPKYLLAYLLSNQTRSFKIVKIDVNKDYIVQNVDFNYHLNTFDDSQQPHVSKDNLKCPDASYRFLIINPVGFIDASANKVMTLVHNDAVGMGYKTKTLLNLAATTKAIENWLSCPALRGVFYVGYGDKHGIITIDSGLSYKDIASSGLNFNHQTTVFFDASEVFRDPLKSTMIDTAESQKYIGEITDKKMYIGDQVSACFWGYTVLQYSMTKSLHTCNKKYDPLDTFGIGGNGSDYLEIPRGASKHR